VDHFQRTLLNRTLGIEIASWANLYQNQQIITNQLLTLGQMQENERIRKLERMQSIWTEEFKHRGMSPLEAFNLAETELKILTLINEIQELVSEYSAEDSNAEEIVSNRLNSNKILGAWTKALTPGYIFNEKVEEFRIDIKNAYLNALEYYQAELETLPESMLSSDKKIRQLVKDILKTEEELPPPEPTPTPQRLSLDKDFY
jgi:hypothetical protein